MSIRAKYDIISKTLKHDGHEYSGESSLSHLRELVAAEDPDTEITLPRQTVYTSGWNRNGMFEIGGLVEYSATVEGRPVLRGHNDKSTISGRCGSGSVVQAEEGREALQQDVLVSGRDALQDLASGADFGFSIAPLETSHTEVHCNIHHAPLSECECWFGDTDEETGTPFRAVLYGCEHGETSITPYPACEGTGGHAARLAVPRSLQLKARRIRFSSDFRGELDERDQLTAKLAAEQSRVAALAVERDRLQLEADDKRIVEARKIKAIQGSHAEILAAYRKDREAGEFWIAHMSDNQLSQTLSQAPGQLRDEDLAPTGQSAADQLFSEVQRRCAADPKLNPVEEWARLRAKADI